MPGRIVHGQHPARRHKATLIRAMQGRDQCGIGYGALLPAERPRRDEEATHEPRHEDRSADVQGRERRAADHHLAQRIREVRQGDQPGDRLQEVGHRRRSGRTSRTGTSSGTGPRWSCRWPIPRSSRTTRSRSPAPGRPSPRAPRTRWPTAAIPSISTSNTATPTPDDDHGLHERDEQPHQHVRSDQLPALERRRGEPLEDQLLPVGDERDRREDADLHHR